MQVFNHPNVIKIREYYRPKSDVLHIVMEYADDGTLSHHIRQRHTK